MSVTFAKQHAGSDDGSYREVVAPAGHRVADVGLAAEVSGVADGPVARSHRVRPPKLYRIGEVVDYSGMSRQTIHNYTTMGLLREMKWTAGGHRLYDESVFERLDVIAAMKRENKSLEEIRHQLAVMDDGEDAQV